eukprot:Blabericola_migrator_1__1584@NODE_141_length_13107_cov_85_385736_g123_i0_p12_GENE_NODE_141_length_13107_cov_85_385736_g123_i0NODE_141_length_13107_cov_85_385736_g123_i0_p12_ORF_typecomplete_len117_score23_88MLTD_N/PF06474_12/0_29_NODE_141_length_13107_cov_85_385736_g123_i095699919
MTYFRSFIDLIAFGSTGVCPAEWIFFTNTESEYVEALKKYEARRQQVNEAKGLSMPSAAEPLMSPKALTQLFQASNEFLDFVCRHMVTTELLMVPNGVMAVFRSIMLEMQVKLVNV